MSMAPPPPHTRKEVSCFKDQPTNDMGYNVALDFPQDVDHDLAPKFWQNKRSFWFPPVLSPGKERAVCFIFSKMVVIILVGFQTHQAWSYHFLYAKKKPEAERWMNFKDIPRKINASEGKKGRKASLCGIVPRCFGEFYAIPHPFDCCSVIWASWWVADFCSALPPSPLNKNCVFNCSARFTIWTCKILWILIFACSPFEGIFFNFEQKWWHADFGGRKGWLTTVGQCEMPVVFVSWWKLKPGTSNGFSPAKYFRPAVSAVWSLFAFRVSKIFWTPGFGADQNPAWLKATDGNTPTSSLPEDCV